jgi:GDPmannose 4,6-dehydratase
MLNACSREIFGNYFSGSADEETPMSPSTPYGINKAAGRWMIAAYRDQYDLFLSNAILFNHESPHRGENFVTRKISKRVAEIANGTARSLQLGNLSIRRDWGFAGDFVEAMWRSLQIDEGHDFVLGTGVTHSIQDFAELAFQCVDLDWQCYVETRPELARQGEGGTISANPSKAGKMLDWHPSVSFVDLVEMMVAADRRSLSVEKSRQAA